MEKMVFKNLYLNVIFGAILIIFAIVGFFTGFLEDFLPIIIGVILVLLSTKRFLFTFKKIISKNATLILVLEFILDLVFAGLLIYLQDHVELFLGLVIYTRGVSYLIINYIATRKVKIFQYLLNIVYLTFGAFLMFTSYNSVEFISIFILVLLLLFGAIYLQDGIRKIVEKGKKKEAEKKAERKIEKLEDKVKEARNEQKKNASENEVLEKKVQKLETHIEKEINYSNLTLAELKTLAKKRELTGYSQLSKADLIEKLKK